MSVPYAAALPAHDPGRADRLLALARQHRIAPIADAPPAAEGPRLHRLDDLLRMALPPSEPLVTDLIGAGEAAIVAAEPNVGKTWLALELARCVAAGIPFLDRFPTVAGPTVYIDEESALRPLRARLEMMEIGNPVGDVPMHVASGLGIALDRPQGIAMLESVLTPIEPKLVIIDSLTRIHSASENDAGEMSRVLGAARRLSQKLGFAVVLVHHLRKRNVAAGNEGADRMRGSTELRAWPDCVMLLSEHAEDPNTLTLEVAKQRNRERLQPFAVRREVDAEAGTVRLSYAGEPAFDAVTSGGDIVAAIAAVTEQAGPDAADALTLAAWLGCSADTARRHANNLVRAGLVEQANVKGSGRGRSKTVYTIRDR